MFLVIIITLQKNFKDYVDTSPSLFTHEADVNDTWEIVSQKQRVIYSIISCPDPSRGFSMVENDVEHQVEELNQNNTFKLSNARTSSLKFFAKTKGIYRVAAVALDESCLGDIFISNQNNYHEDQNINHCKNPHGCCFFSTGLGFKDITFIVDNSSNLNINVLDHYTNDSVKSKTSNIYEINKLNFNSPIIIYIAFKNNIPDDSFMQIKSYENFGVDRIDATFQVGYGNSYVLPVLNFESVKTQDTELTFSNVSRYMSIAFVTALLIVIAILLIRGHNDRKKNNEASQDSPVSDSELSSISGSLNDSNEINTGKVKSFSIENISMFLRENDTYISSITNTHRKNSFSQLYPTSIDEDPETVNSNMRPYDDIPQYVPPKKYPSLKKDPFTFDSPNASQNDSTTDFDEKTNDSSP